MPSIKHRKYSKLVFGLDRLYSIELQSCLVLQKLWSLGSMSSKVSSLFLISRVIQIIYLATCMILDSVRARCSSCWSPLVFHFPVFSFRSSKLPSTSCHCSLDTPYPRTHQHRLPYIGNCMNDRHSKAGGQQHPCDEEYTLRKSKFRFIYPGPAALTIIPRE